jgi:hypothetical protein
LGQHCVPAGAPFGGQVGPESGGGGAVSAVKAESLVPSEESVTGTEASTVVASGEGAAPSGEVASLNDASS